MSTNFTYNLWVYPTVAPTNNGAAAVPIIWANNTTSNNKGYISIQYAQESSVFKIYINRTDSAGNDQVSANQTLALNTWAMLTYTWDGSTQKLFLNGNAVPIISSASTRTGTNTTSGATEGFYLGRDITNSREWQGMIDEVGVWSRALRADEITGLHNSASGLQYAFSVTPPTSGIVSYWKLDESSGNASDSVGSITLTNNGTLTYAAGKINNAADGGSSNTTKFLANTSSAPLTGAQIASAFTMNFWFNLYDVASDKSLFFINNSDGSNRRQANMRFMNTGDKLNVTVFPTGTGTASISSNTTLVGSTWYMGTITYDGTNLRLYVNGGLESVVAFTYGTGSSNTPATSILTQYEGGGNETASALADEGGIWSRALSGSEIMLIYNAGTGISYPFSNNQTLTANQGSYTLTGQDATFNVGFTMNALMGSYTYTGYDANLSRVGWDNQPINSSVWSEPNRSSSSWSQQAKN